MTTAVRAAGAAAFGSRYLTTVGYALLTALVVLIVMMALRR